LTIFSPTSPEPKQQQIFDINLECSEQIQY
jgi:hypothetical protein